MSHIAHKKVVGILFTSGFAAACLRNGITELNSYGSTS